MAFNFTNFAQPQQAQPTLQQQPKLPQDGDFTFSNPPADSISCIAVNGTVNTPSNILIAGSWDNTVSEYIFIYIFV